MKFSEYFTYNPGTGQAKELGVKGRVLKSLYKNVRIPWWLIIIGAFLAVFNSIVILTQYENYMAIFTGALSDLSPLWQYLAASFIQYLLIFASVLSDVAYVTIVTRVRKKMWRKMVRLPLKSFEDETPSGMLSRVTSDAEYASKPFAAAIAVLQILLYILSMSAAAPKDMPQALGFLIVTVILAVATIVVSVKICSKATTYVQNRISALTAHYSEQLANIKFVKASGAEEKAIERSFGLIEKRYRAALYSAFATGLQTLANNFTYIIIYSCAFLGGILAIRAGAISDTTPISAVYAFGMALELTLVAIMTLPSFFAATVGGSKKLVSIFAQAEEDTESGAAPEGLSQDKLDGALRTENLSFAYGDRTTLDGVSLVIPQGKITALVGPNGSGKSTLVKVLDRLYPAENGDLLLGDTNASDVSLKTWREQFAVVSQRPSLFSGSLRDNICYGMKREVSEEELARVVHLANLDEVVASHEGGLDYVIGIKGTGLSGGEQQRVAIARALLRDAKILILDEATANLDAKTEDEVKKGLVELMKGRTVIEIAHSASAIRDADHVIVLDSGRVAAAGTCAKLVESNAFFRQLVREG
ncbi:MAG: ABC transporter ATP-binding protein [Firmicutes bacterium]|nr:ABC transporter ATP-binding protein [Bacillota bacterium]